MSSQPNTKYQWTIERLETGKLCKVTADGFFSVNGHSEMIGDLVSQKFWKPGMNLLIDDRKVEFDGTDIDLVKKVSDDFRSFEERIGGGKVVILNGFAD